MNMKFSALNQVGSSEEFEQVQDEDGLFPASDLEVQATPMLSGSLKKRGTSEVESVVQYWSVASAVDAIRASGHDAVLAGCPLGEVGQEKFVYSQERDAALSRDEVINSLNDFVEKNKKLGLDGEKEDSLTVAAAADHVVTEEPPAAEKTAELVGDAIPENGKSSPPKGESAATVDVAKTAVGRKSFSDLLKMSAGSLKPDEVKLDQVSAKELTFFSSVQNPLQDDDVDSLADVVKRGVESKSLASPPNQKNAESATAELSAQSDENATLPKRDEKSAVAAMPSQTGGAMTQSNLGVALGNLAVDVIASPFVALSTVGKHIAQKIQAIPSVPPGPGATNRSLRVSADNNHDLAAVNSLGSITHWKCERIEKSAVAVRDAATALRQAEDYVVWEDRVRQTAEQKGCSVEDVVSSLQSEQEYADLKAGMDGCWERNAQKVADYRKAADEFMRHITSVVREYPNSETEIKERVDAAMKEVRKDTEIMPGFGEDVGEYQRTLADRVREVAKQIAEFVRSLLERIVGKKDAASDLAM